MISVLSITGTNAVMCAACSCERSTPQQTYSSPASSGISHSDSGASERLGVHETPSGRVVVVFPQVSGPRGAPLATQSAIAWRLASDRRAFGTGGIGLASSAIRAATSS